MAALPPEERVLIEHEGKPLGMIVGELEGYVVYACAQHVRSLDRKVFRSMKAAEKQIRLCDKVTEIGAPK